MKTLKLFSLLHIFISFFFQFSQPHFLPIFFTANTYGKSLKMYTATMMCNVQSWKNDKFRNVYFITTQLTVVSTFLSFITSLCTITHGNTGGSWCNFLFLFSACHLRFFSSYLHNIHIQKWVSCGKFQANFYTSQEENSWKFLTKFTYKHVWKMIARKIPAVIQFVLSSAPFSVCFYGA